MLSQDMYSERVEGAHEGQAFERHRTIEFTAFAQEPVYALAHLPGRFVGKGDRQDFLRINAISDEMKDAEADCFRFSGSGSGNNQKWTVKMRHCLFLTVVERVEMVHETPL